LTVLDTGRSISEIAYELGFKYPQHFTRAFKNVTGQYGTWVNIRIE